MTTENGDVVSYVSSIAEEKWQLIGSGAHGQVFLVIGPVRAGEKKYVVKKINIINAWKNRQQEIRELVILRDVRHERIVQFYGHIESKFELYLIMAFMPKGSLSSYVYKKPLNKNLSKVSLFTRQILEGVAYLHSKSIIHRDIKGENVLLGEDAESVKLTDFGVSKVISESSNATTNSAGTYNYKAPETFQSDTVYDTKADIWSVGCTVVEMFTGQLPYGILSTTMEMINTIDDRKRPDHSCTDVPQSLQEFFDKCFEYQPGERPTAKELLDGDGFCKT